MRKIHDPLAMAQEAGREIKALYGENLVSVILYGSAAGGDFDPQRSDINLLIVLRELGFEAVCILNPIWKKLERQRFGLPIFMDCAYIQRSLDSYPIEFLNMKGCYKVIVGEDVLLELNIDREHIRLQAERELRGKLLHLLSSGIEIGNKIRELKQLMEISLKDFGAVFMALLFLKEQKAERNRKRIFDLVEKVYDIKDQPFSKALRALEKGNKQEIAAIFPGYVKGIQVIIERIDLAMHN